MRRRMLEYTGILCLYYYYYEPCLNIHILSAKSNEMCSYNYNHVETNIQFRIQDLNEDFSLRYPKLYTPGHYDLLFNKKVFALSAAEGIISSLVLFFIPYGAFFNAVRPDGHDLVSHNAFGCVVASILIVAVTLRVSGILCHSRGQGEWLWQ